MTRIAAFTVTVLDSGAHRAVFPRSSARGSEIIHFLEGLGFVVGGWSMIDADNDGIDFTQA